MFYKEHLIKQNMRIGKNEFRINELEEKIENLKEEINRIETNNIEEKIKIQENLKKIVNQQKKLEKLTINALNEQRLKITQIIEVIKYICIKQNIKLSEKPTTNKKKGK